MKSCVDCQTLELKRATVFSEVRQLVYVREEIPTGILVSGLAYAAKRHNQALDVLMTMSTGITKQLLTASLAPHTPVLIAQAFHLLR